MSKYVLNVKNRLTQMTVGRITCDVSGFLNNCGYHLISVSGNGISKKENTREAMKCLYDFLVGKFSHRNGCRKLVMSGAFSTTDGGYYSSSAIHNPTALFMLANDVPLAGEPTQGKYHPKYMLQMGEIDIHEHMDKKEICKKFNALYTIDIVSEGGW